MVHQRARLSILSILEEAGQADFTYLRDALALTDGNLGRHLKVLVGAGFITSRKSYNGRRTKTWATITNPGRQAFLAEITALRELVADVDQRGTTQNDTRRSRAPSRCRTVVQQSARPAKDLLSRASTSLVRSRSVTVERQSIRAALSSVGFVGVRSGADREDDDSGPGQGSRPGRVGFSGWSR